MLSSMHIIKVNPLLDRYNKLGGPIWTCRPVREGKFKRSTTTDSYLFSQKKFILWELFSGQAVLLFEYNKFTLFLLPY